MTQLTLFSQDILAKQPKRTREYFNEWNLATRYATEARGSGRYSDVFIVSTPGKPEWCVITEEEV